MGDQVAISKRSKWERMEAHLERQPSDIRAARQALRENRQASKRMAQMHADLKCLAMRCKVFEGVIEHCFEVMRAQADLIREYAKDDV